MRNCLRHPFEMDDYARACDKISLNFLLTNCALSPQALLTNHMSLMVIAILFRTMYTYPAPSNQSLSGIKLEDMTQVRHFYYLYLVVGDSMK